MKKVSRFNKFLSIVRKSIDYNTMESSTRIQGYLIIALIYLMVFIFCAIEMTSFINSVFILHKAYAISNEIIIIFSAVLAHHLGILFNKRAGEKGDINDKMEEKLNSIIDTKLNGNGNGKVNGNGASDVPPTTPTNPPVHDSDLA